MTAPLTRGRSLVHDVVATAGEPLDEATREHMQARFGEDFSQVRVHADRQAEVSARSISAQAYTAGNHIAFGAGQYAPATAAGQHLLAHELAHVVQARAATIPVGGGRPDGSGLRLSRSADASEHEAEQSAHRAMSVRAPLRRPFMKPRRLAPSSGSGRRPLLVQRRIRLGATTLDGAAAAKLASDLVAGPLKGLAGGPSLVREAVSELHGDPDVLSFADVDAVASNVRARVLASHYMRTSQGTTKALKAFSYPDREGDGTKGVAPKVNDDATGLWGPVQSWPGTYYFDLSPTGKADPYKALIRLFTEHSDPHKRTLIHCDYLVSLIEFRAYAENLGPQAFNALVASGEVSMRLKYDGFTELGSTPRPGSAAAAAGRVPPLRQVTLTDKNELLLGDHVVFFNHETYDVLTSVKRDVWRLENAIVIDRVGSQFRYQGHGYFTPVTEDALLNGMLGHYNRNVDKARAIARRVADPGPPGLAARNELTRDYPNVRPVSPGQWEIAGASQLCSGRPVKRELKHLTAAEAPALKNPCDGVIRVRRPIERAP